MRVFLAEARQPRPLVLPRLFRARVWLRSGLTAHGCEVASRTTQGGARLIDDPKLRSDLALLDAEIRALEVTNWRFLLTPSEQRRLPVFASVLKLKGAELQQDVNALLARLAGPVGL